MAWIEALRWQNNQFIYKDFGVPWGPVSGIFAYIFLLLFKNISLAYFLSAIFINVASSLIIYFVVYRVTSDRFSSNLSAIFTAFWFLTQIGGIYVDHLSYFFILLTIFVFTLNISSLKKIVFLSILVSLSFWTKQTTGALGSSIAVFTFFIINRKIFFNFRFIVLFISINLLIAFLILFIIYYFSNFQNFLNSFLWYNLEYSKVEENKQPLVLLTNFFLPFKINILTAISNFNLGVIVFYPMVVLVYASYLLLIFFQNFFKKNLVFFSVYFFFLFSSLVCMPMIGRNFLDVVWSLGAVFGLNFFLIKKCSSFKHNNLKRFFILLLTIFIGISLLHFLIPKVLVSSKKFDNHALYPLKISNIWGDYINIQSLSETSNYIKKNMKFKNNEKFYFIDDKSIIFSIINNIPSSGYNTYFDANINIPRGNFAYLEWQKNQVDFLHSNKVKYIISSLHNTKRVFRVRKQQVSYYQKDIMYPKLIIDFIKTRYKVLYETNEYKIFGIIE